MAVEQIRITAELLDSDGEVITSRSVTGSYQEPEEDTSDTCDIDFISASNGGPVILPKNPPKGL